MTDKQAGATPPAVPQADDRFSRIEKIVRWAFWLAIAGAMVWVFVDLLITH